MEQHGYMERKDADELLWNKLPQWMDDKQKKIKISHLITELSYNSKIKNDGIKSKPKWVLT
jgi:ATP-dependent DNA helicase RecG